MRELRETKKHEKDETKRATNNPILRAVSNKKYDEYKVRAMKRILAKAKK